MSYARITLVRCVGLFRSYRLEKSMMIFGEPRSGSTWLMELLAHSGNCIVVWEPTHPNLGLNPAQYKGEPRIFEDPSETNTLLSRDICDILTLKKFNKWTLNHTTFRSIVYSRNTLTKLVHGTLLLPWILVNVPLAYQPIYIVRHPIAMALSQMKGGMYMEREMMSDKTFRRLYPDRYDEYREFIIKLKSPLEKLVALWCLYLKHLIQHTNKSDKLIFIHYEDLLMNPFGELKKICVLWGIDLDIAALDIRKPSKTDFHKQLKGDPMKQLSKWQHQVSAAEKERIQGILDYFKIDLYNANSALPIKS